MKGGSVNSVKVAKTAAATTFEDESVKVAGDNTRRRIAANSRNMSNKFWTSLLAGGSSGGNQKKSTLG